ncbi:hypothetical protein SRHO_G00072370 [Serrasalmus rhombeus]
MLSSRTEARWSPGLKTYDYYSYIWASAIRRSLFAVSLRFNPNYHKQPDTAQNDFALICCAVVNLPMC